MEILFSVWAIVALAIGLNIFAAGVAAVLFGWRRSWPRSSRILLAASLSGAFPFGMLIPALFLELSSEFEELTYLMFGFAAIFVMATAVSLPGAIIISRKLEKPDDDFLAFE